MDGHRRIVEQFYDRFGAGDLDGAVAMFAAGVRITDPGLGTVEGLQALRNYLLGLKGAVPDARAIVDRAFEWQDTVIVEGRFVGTSPRPLPGTGGESEPVDAPIELLFADFARIQDQQIVEYRTYYDQVSLLTQLGLMH